MKEKGPRLSGPRAIAGEALLALTLVACGGSAGAAPAQSQPEASPTGVTIGIVATPEVTNSPAPTAKAENSPSVVPSVSPSLEPSKNPENSPSNSPVVNSPEPTIAPTESPSPVITPEPLNGTIVARQLEKQEDKDITKTSLKSVKAGINDLWESYESELSPIKWADSQTGNLSKDYFMLYAKLIEEGKHLKNASEKVGFAAGFIATILVTIDRVDNPELKNALSEQADDIYDYAVTTIDPKHAEESKAKLNEEIIPLMIAYAAQ